MPANRVLTWDGCNNVRDLGGLLTCRGGLTRFGAVVRGDHPARLSAAGWAALYGYGIRTIIELHTDGMQEDNPDAAPRPAEITTLPVAIEDVTDTEFVSRWVDGGLWCTPLYYRDALERWPARHAAALRAIATARPGGVLFHCVRGYDRTGIIALLVLALAGVTPDEIAADYALSVDPEREARLAGQGTTTREVILSTLAWLDAQDYLRRSGLSGEEIEAIRGRLVG